MIEFRKKYFFFDIDGTLAVGNPGQYIPESAKKTIKLLELKGNFCAIATGRSQAMAIDYCQEIGFRNMVSDGGNSITIDNELIKIDPMDKDSIIELLQECESKSLAWAVSKDNSKFKYSKDSRFQQETNDTYTETIVDSNLNIDNIENIYKAYISCTLQQENRLEKLKNVPHIRHTDDYIFIEPDDKSVGIKAIMDYYNAPYEDVVVFGDGKNDLKMFTDQWTSIAMGNAYEELKEKASFITKNAEDNGIEYACKHFGWI